MGGDDRKQLGLDLVMSHNVDFVIAMRNEALKIAEIAGEVCADDLREIARRDGIEPNHPNAWGAVFRSGLFRRIGYRPSTTPSAHARVVSVWGLA